ncbi:MAG: sulfotransferase family 2 domain-containing protein [bacterium]
MIYKSSNFNNLKIFIARIYRLYFGKYPYRQYMIKYKCIFIHIPKTAGTSILSLLTGKERIRRDHNNFFIFYKANPSLFNKYFKFTFVRNPYDRIISCYEYLINGGNNNEDKYYEKLFNEKYDSFDKFVLNFLNHNVIHENDLFKPQYLFIYDYTGKCKVDFVGRYENIDADSVFILNKLGINKKLPVSNQSKRKNIEEYYKNEAVKKKIKILYAKDFEILNYNSW